MVSDAEKMAENAKLLVNLFVSGAAILIGTAMTAENPPTKINRQQEKGLYDTIRPLLTNDAATYPQGQSLISDQNVEVKLTGWWLVNHLHHV